MEGNQSVSSENIVSYLLENSAFLDNFVNSHVKKAKLENWFNEKLEDELCVDEVNSGFRQEEPNNQVELRRPLYSLGGGQRHFANVSVMYTRCKILRKYGIRRSCQHQKCRRN